MEGLRIAPVLRKNEKVPHNALKCELDGTDLCRVWALIRSERRESARYLTIDEISALGIKQKDLDEVCEQIMKSAQWLCVDGYVPREANLSVREDSASPTGLYVLSCKEPREGAVLLSFPEIRKKIILNYPEYRIVMPSSIHEIVFYHKNELNDLGIECLKKIVKEANASDAIQKEDILSNEVYYLNDDGSLKTL